MTGSEVPVRQVSVEKLFADNQSRLGLTWLGGRQGGSQVLTGEAALKPTIGQVGHMNFIHPFRVQILGAAELAHLNGLAPGQAATFLAEPVNRAQYVEARFATQKHQHIGVQRGNRLRVAHLRHRPKQGVVPDHTRRLHLIKQLDNCFHFATLSPSIVACRFR